MKIAILGSGNGGCATAFDWAAAGHEVYICDFEGFTQNIDAIAKNGGIYSEGQLEGFSKVKYSGTDIGKSVMGADMVFIVGPAYSTEPFANACKPYLEKGQIVVVCPSSCGGSIVFKKCAGLNLTDESIIVAETSTLPYAVRLMEPGKIHVYLKLKGGLFLSALPSKNTKKIYNLMKDLYPGIGIAKNVLQTTLQNGNPIIHPVITLLNAGLIERTGGDFNFYEDGVTTAVGRLIEALDKERIEIGKKIGIEIVPDPVLGMKQGYMQEATYDIGFSKAEGFLGIKAQHSLDYRYFNEDVGYGLVFMAELGKKIGVDTPSMDSVIHLCSIAIGKDYRGEGKRTMKSMGIDSYSINDLIKKL